MFSTLMTYEESPFGSMAPCSFYNTGVTVCPTGIKHAIYTVDVIAWFNRVRTLQLFFSLKSKLISRKEFA